nr:hypothetical protein [Candidatus Sigynarchaeota archaeon]
MNSALPTRESRAAGGAFNHDTILPNSGGDVLKIYRVSGERAFSVVGDWWSRNTTVAVGATFPVLVTVNNTGSEMLTITRIRIAFTDMFGVPFSGFTFSDVINPAATVPANGTTTYHMWVTVPGGFTRFNEQLYVSAEVNGTAGGVPQYKNSAASEIYNMHDSIIVVQPPQPPQLSLTCVRVSASPGLIVNVVRSNVYVSIQYNVTSTYWAPISIDITGLVITNMGYILSGSLWTPPAGFVTVPAYGTATVFVNFVVDASTVTMPDTMDINFNVVNHNASQGLSQAAATPTTLQLIVPLNIKSLTTVVHYGYNYTVLTKGSYVSDLDTIDIIVQGTPGVNLAVNITSSGSSYAQLLVWMPTPGFYNTSLPVSGIGLSAGLLEVRLYSVMSGDLGVFDQLVYDRTPPTYQSATLESVAVPYNGEGFAEATSSSDFVLVLSDAVAITMVTIAFLDATNTAAATLLMTRVSANTYRITLSSSTAGMAGIWQAGRIPGTIPVRVNATDQLGLCAENAFMFNLRICDTIAPTLDISIMDVLAGQMLDPSIGYQIRVIAPYATGESYVQEVIMFYAPSLPSANTYNGWRSMAGTKNVTFSQGSGDEWLGVLPSQMPGSKLYWAFYALDYAGNSNGAGLAAVGSATLNYANNITQPGDFSNGFGVSQLIETVLIVVAIIAILTGVVKSKVKKAGILDLQATHYAPEHQFTPDEPSLQLPQHHAINRFGSSSLEETKGQTIPELEVELMDSIHTSDKDKDLQAR